MQETKLKLNIDKYKFKKFIIIGFHKKLGEQRGKKIFATYVAADSYLKTLTRYKAYKNYSSFLIEGVE